MKLTNILAAFFLLLLGSSVCARESVAEVRRLRGLGYGHGGNGHHRGGDNGRDHPGCCNNNDTDGNTDNGDSNGDANTQVGENTSTKVRSA